MTVTVIKGADWVDVAFDADRIIHVGAGYAGKADAADAQTRAASTEFAYSELLKSGVTSVVDIKPAWDGWAFFDSPS
jgi:hypothetical protein